jgi:hypothetical protein
MTISSEHKGTSLDTYIKPVLWIRDLTEKRNTSNPSNPSILIMKPVHISAMFLCLVAVQAEHHNSASKITSSGVSTGIYWSIQEK